MASSMGAAAVRTQHKTLRESLDDVRPKAAKILTPSEPVRTVQNNDDKGAFLALIDEARIRAGLSQKEMSINAVVNEGAFSEALKGARGNFAAHWLDRQPKSFRQAFHKLLGLRWGIDEATESEIEAERIGELVSLLIKRTVRS
jgi:hypothetical protein